MPDAAALLRFRRGSASTPKRCLRSLLDFILPAIEQRRSNPVPPVRLGNAPALDPFLDDLSLLLCTPLHLLLLAHPASFELGGPESYLNFLSSLSGEHYTGALRMARERSNCEFAINLPVVIAHQGQL